ncbi:MAG: hypothetical protein V3V01_18445 [Acidimicrobiales bacterium]
MTAIDSEPTIADPDQAAASESDNRWRWKWLLSVTAGLVLFVGGIGVGVAYAKRDLTVDPVFAAGELLLVKGSVLSRALPERTTDPYVGLGTWVDRFDYSPPYTGETPPVSASDVPLMAAQGVRTIYLQVSHSADRSPGPTEDPWVLTELLLAAHSNDMAVVAWYLPKWGDDDLAKVKAMADFEILGHRFDGIGIDIEYNQGGLEPAERSRRLVQLSRATKSYVGSTPLAAIVLPPVLTEVVNSDFWPEFPWPEIAPLYDVWMPMSYWSFRSESSGYKDGYTYNEQSTRLLRELLADPEALVHGIGGIGAADSAAVVAGGEPLAVVDDLEGFARSLSDTGSIGGSVYDWVTLGPLARATLDELFANGSASSLPAP